MTGSTASRDQLLGLVSFEPPSRLRQGARFASAEEHRAFLERARTAPDELWTSLAAELCWREKPTAAGEPGDFFPGGTLNIVEACLARQRAKPEDAPFLYRIDPGTQEVSGLTLEWLLGRVAAVEVLLAELDLAPADRVFLALADRGAMLAAALACLGRGLTAVPTNARYTDERRARRFAAARCKAEVRDPGVAPSAPEGGAREVVLEAGWETRPGRRLEPVAVRPMHPAFVLADWKGQLLSVPTAGFLVQALSTYRYVLDGRGAGDVLWLMTPPHHAATLAATIGALVAGGRVGVLPIEATADLEMFLDLLRRARPRVLFANLKLLMSVVRGALEAGSSPRAEGPALLAIEGETVEPRFYQFVRDRLFDGGTHVTQVLSRPETGGIIAGPYAPQARVRPASVGSAAPGLDLVIVDPSSKLLEPNHGGLLALRRAVPSLALELQRLAPPIALEVMARIDNEGCIWTMGEARVGRSQGQPVPLREVEARLATMAGVDQAAIVRYADPEGNDRTCAFIRPEDGRQVELEALRAAVRESFSPAAMPDEFLVVRELPVSRSGKLLRTVLQRVAAGQPLEADHVEVVADPNVVDDLVEAWRVRAGEGRKGG